MVAVSYVARSARSWTALATPRRIASWSEVRRETGTPLVGVADRAQRSGDRVSHADGISGCTGVCDPRCRDLLFRLGCDRGRGDRSRAGRTVGDLHLLWPAQSP